MTDASRGRDGGAARKGRPTDPLTALEQTVNDLAQYAHSTLTDHAGLLSELPPRVEDNTEMLASLVGQMGDVVKNVDTLMEDQPPAQRFPPICWQTIPAEDLAREWEHLACWVRDVLVGWYHPSREELPDCWPLHRGALVELSALERLWQQAHARRAPATAVAEWHTRWRGDLLAGVGKAIEREADTGPGGDQSRCTAAPGIHLGKPLPGTAPRRPQPPPPEPPQQVPVAPGLPGGPGAQQRWQPSRPAGHPANLAAQSFPSSPQESLHSSRRNTDGTVTPHNEAKELAGAQHWWPHYERAREQMVTDRRRAESG